MNKTLSIAMTLALAAGASCAMADDNHTSSQTTMQRCVTEAKAKNDGSSDAVITKTCTSKLKTEHSRTSTTDSGPAVPDSSSTSESSTTVVEEKSTTDQPPK
jgi:hypothetical protein